ncbi:MAG: iron-containing alcohol dehydrogenase [Candidatus Helarchaeota archaeon]|nr:iron-containing alcohol dehydrogenase [Candidatus Helarchaeota archaeon]
MSQSFLSPKIFYGFGKIKQLRYLRGNRALIITDKIIVGLGFIDKIAKQLKKSKKPMEYKIFDEVEPDPSDTTVLKGAEIAQEFKPDWIIAIGGGSTMDVAKMVWALYENPEIKLIEISPLKRIPMGKKSSLVTIPTTSGTGAEITFAGVITNTEKKYKMTLANFEITPNIAIIDPNLTLTMPPKLTAVTGLDALTHAIEGYVSPLKNDFSDGHCLKAIQLIFKWLPQSYQSGKSETPDKTAREKVHYAATIAGLGFGNSSGGLAHGIGHSIGAVFNIQHGFCVSILLPYTINYLDSTSRKNFQEVVNFLQLKNGKNATDILANNVRKLLTSLDVPHSFKELGIKEDEFKNKSEKVLQFTLTDLSTRTCPRKATDDELKKLIEYSYYGNPVDF